MQIRPACHEDVPRLVEMGRRQMAALYPDWPESPAHLATIGAQLIESPTGVMFVAEDHGQLLGMIGMVLFPHHLTGLQTAGEVMWWVEPEARGIGPLLLKRAERWGAECGATQIQMMAPNDRVGVLYRRRGYRQMETTWHRPVSVSMTAITVHDDVLPEASDYAAATRLLTFRDVQTSPDVTFHGLADPVDDRLIRWITGHYPTLTPTLSFVRQSPETQDEPNYIHTDRDMGEWTAIYYLTDAPPSEDGTTFWRHKVTGAIQSTARTEDDFLQEWFAWRDLPQWEPWHTVTAKPNRAVLFPAGYFHSRAIKDNYGTAGDTARLIQVVFGTGVFQPEGA